MHRFRPGCFFKRGTREGYEHAFQGAGEGRTSGAQVFLAAACPTVCTVGNRMALLRSSAAEDTTRRSGEIVAPATHFPHSGHGAPAASPRLS